MAPPHPGAALRRAESADAARDRRRQRQTWAAPAPAQQQQQQQQQRRRRQAQPRSPDLATDTAPPCARADAADRAAPRADAADRAAGLRPFCSARARRRRDARAAAEPAQSAQQRRARAGTVRHGGSSSSNNHRDEGGFHNGEGANLTAAAVGLEEEDEEEGDEQREEKQHGEQKARAPARGPWAGGKGGAGPQTQAERQRGVRQRQRQRPRCASLLSVRSLSDLHAAAVAARVTQQGVVAVFGESLTRVARQNDERACLLAQLQRAERKPRSAVCEDRMAPFEGYNVPRLSLGWYLWRIVYFLNKYPRVEATFFAEEEGHIAADFSPGQHMPASHERARDMEAVSRGLRSLLLALVYVDRVGQRYPDSPVTSRSLHRIMLTAIFVATKFSDDFSVGAETFARVGGLTVKELLRMEGAFCALIGFNLHVTDREFDAKCLPQLDAAFDIAAARARAGVARSHGTPPHVQYGASSLKGNGATRAGSHPGQLLARASDPERPPSRGLAPPPA